MLQSLFFRKPSRLKNGSYTATLAFPASAAVQRTTLSHDTDCVLRVKIVEEVIVVVTSY